MNSAMYRRYAQRTLAVTLVLSLLLHVAGGALYSYLTKAAARLHLAVPHPEATEAIVTVSDALTFDKHPRVVPRARSHPPPRPIRVAHPLVVLAQLPLAIPLEHLPAAKALRHWRKHELARQAPHARPQPPQRATSKPQPTARLKSERVALEQPEPQSRAVEKKALALMTRDQMARLDQEFSQTIAAARSSSDPLRVPPHPPVAPKRYHFQFQGRIGSLRSGQGILTPIKTWSADGYTYYYVTYEVVWQDGTYESGAVPWPIRYRPGEDPFASGIPGQHIPLPPPMPGWMLPAGIHLGKVLQPYFPNQPSTD